MTKFAVSLLIATLAAANLAACQSTQSTVTKIDLPPELDRVLRDYETAWIAEDEDGLANLFAEDGFILRPGHPPVRGRDNIREAYANSGGDLSLHAFDYEIQGSTAYIIGGYSRKPGDPDVGKYILTLQLEESGRWLITADMDNGNQSYN